MGGQLRDTFADASIAGEFQSHSWGDICTWVASLLTPELYTEATMARMHLHEGKCTQSDHGHAALQNYYMLISAEFRKVPDMSDCERLSLFRTGLNSVSKPLSHHRKEAGEGFATYIDLFKYLQLEESRAFTHAQGRSKFDKLKRPEFGGYGFPHRSRPQSKTIWPLKRTANVSFADTLPPPAYDPSRDCVEDPMEVDRPVKTARTSSNSVHMAGGAPSGGRPNQGGRPAHPSPSGRGGRSPYGRGTHGRGSGGRHSGGRGDSSAPVFEGAPGDPCRLNSSISVAQANWLKGNQRCFWCFQGLANWL
eukprot:gene4174-14275_t